MWSPGREQSPSNRFCRSSHGLPLETNILASAGMEQLRFLWPVIYMMLSSLCYRSLRIYYMFSLVFSCYQSHFLTILYHGIIELLELEGTLKAHLPCNEPGYQLPFLLFLPQIHGQIRLHTTYPLSTQALTALTAEHTHALLCASSRLIISCICIWFSCLHNRTGGILSFLLPPIEVKSWFLSQRCHRSPSSLHWEVPWAATEVTRSGGVYSELSHDEENRLLQNRACCKASQILALLGWKFGWELPNHSRREAQKVRTVKSFPRRSKI